jgi:hypothetical protein
MRNIILIALALCSPGSAQFQFGSVVGLIADPSHAPVPGAMVEIRSQSTNVARQATASAAGEYNFISLPPDKYTLTVRHQGFRETTQSSSFRWASGWKPISRSSSAVSASRLR